MTNASNAAGALTAEWDARYTVFAERLPSVEPNSVLIAETAGLQPARALDIGCGVGADAIWLAQHGWDVTALDVSRVALDHAAQRARKAAVNVTWLHARLQDAPLTSGGFDLVTALYPALLHSHGQLAEEALLSAVAPAGALLVVHHANIDVTQAKSHGFDPADYLSHDDVVALLNDNWDVRVDRGRLRVRPAGADGQHTHDDIVIARRRC